jgi:hypothetical protein
MQSVQLLVMEQFESNCSLPGMNYVATIPEESRVALETRAVQRLAEHGTGLKYNGHRPTGSYSPRKVA